MATGIRLASYTSSLNHLLPASRGQTLGSHRLGSAFALIIGSQSSTHSFCISRPSLNVFCSLVLMIGIISRDHYTPTTLCAIVSVTTVSPSAGILDLRCFLPISIPPGCTRGNLGKYACGEITQLRRHYMTKLSNAQLPYVNGISSHLL